MEQLKATVNEERLERHLERFGMVFGFDGARYYLTDAPGVDPMHARVTFNTDDYGVAVRQAVNWLQVRFEFGMG